MARTRADLLHAFQAIADSGKPYRLTVKPEEAAMLVTVLRLGFMQEARHLAPRMRTRIADLAEQAA